MNRTEYAFLLFSLWYFHSSWSEPSKNRLMAMIWFVVFVGEFVLEINR